MKKLFYNDEAMRAHMFNKKSPDQTKDEIGLIDALGLMFNVRKEQQKWMKRMAFQQHINTKKGCTLWIK